MLKQQATILRKIAISLDNVILVSAFLCAYYLRQAAGTVGELNNYVWILLFAIPSWFVLLNHFKLYESLRLRSSASIVWALVKVHVISGMLLASVIFMFDPHSYSRRLFTYFLLLSFLLISLSKVVIKVILHRFRLKGFNIRNILIVGTGQNALKMCGLINAHREWGLKLVGLISVADGDVSTAYNSVPVIGSINNLIDICRQRTVDEVVFALEKNDSRELIKYFQDLEDMGLAFSVVIDYLPLRRSRTQIDLFHDEVPLLSFSSVSFNSDQLFAKRCLDVIGALVGLFVTALMLPYIALAIKLDSLGPVFFGQFRVRENGRRFICWKFRTMCVDAEERKQDLMALNEMKGAMFKVKNDPRVTRVGGFLRKTSLDELPQFWNVLRGEMSLVGTRPPTPDEVASYENWHHKRISIKPGITGLWQVSGRNQVQEFDDVVRLDILYIETWTIWLDVRIILKTPLVMLNRQGAS
ncbi:MAG: sugar transferase [Proteobacteria bacterium]|nr:sugar transferase [Pseudomonadota bacterium]